MWDDFFSNSGENHYKCQDKLLDAFKEMTELHESGWRLCFIGSVAEDTDSLKYLLGLYRKSRDIPVEIITDAPFPLLKEYFAKTSIYWHATGMGSKPSDHPEKQEHFGITTVEAMSGGAVPIVINAAGQKETIVNGEDGFLWDNKNELIDYTTNVASDPELLKKISKRAERDSKKFDKSAFEKSFSEIMDRLSK
jgi:glycosyltransferase involved in cell wall biosynthesis